MSHPIRIRSRIASLAAASALALLAGACSAPQQQAAETPGVTADTVTIGTHQPLTGPAAAGYSSISAASKAFYEYVNANGGVNGRKIDFVVKDDGYNPATTQSVVRELVQEENVFAIVGGLGTPTHTAVLDYLNQQQVPDLFVASGSTSWNQPEKYPYTFGFNADYLVEAGALAAYAKEKHAGKKVCLLGQDDDFGDEFIQGAENVLGAGGLTEVQRYSTSNQDVSAQIGALKAAGCEITMLATINGFTALAVGTAAKLNWFPLWFSSSSGGDYPTLATYLGPEVAPKLLQGFTGVNYLPMADGAWVDLFKQINQQYNNGAPFDGNTIYGMSQAYTFTEALAAAGENPTRDSLVEAVRSGRLKGNGIVPLIFSADSHSAFDASGITMVDSGVQDYAGSTYRLEGTTVSPTEASEIPLPASLSGS